MALSRKNSKANIEEPQKTLPPTGSGSQEPDVCSICLDIPTVISSLDSCNHYYCYQCIYQWSKQSNTCPLCKARFHSISKVEEQQLNNSNKRKRESSDEKGRKKSKRDGVTSVPHRDMQMQAGPNIPFGGAPVNSMIQLLLSHMSGVAFFGGARPRPRRQFRELPGGVIDLTDEVESDNDSDSDSDDYHPHERIPAPPQRRDFIRERDNEGRVELEIVDSDDERGNINSNNNNNNDSDDTDDFRINRFVPNERANNNQGSNNNIVIDLSD